MKLLQDLIHKGLRLRDVELLSPDHTHVSDLRAKLDFPRKHTKEM